MRIMLVSLLCTLLCSTPLMADDNYNKQFDMLDKNNDSNLSKQEFVNGKVKVNREKVVKLFPDMRDVERMNDRKLKEKLFDRMDKNRDGLLTTDEWRQVAPNILDVRF